MREHLDEARAGAETALRDIAEHEPGLAAAVLVVDLFGRISATLWLVPSVVEQAPLTEAVQTRLNAACAQFAGQVAVATAASPADETDLLHRTA